MINLWWRSRKQGVVVVEASIREGRARSLYGRYKAEVHTAIGILVPLILAGGWLANASIGWRGWLAGALAGLLVFNTAVAYRSWRRAQALRVSALLPYNDDRAVHDRALKLARTRYHLLGMSAEELQRSTGSDFFARRSQGGEKFAELRILLLHPDAPGFHQRIEEVNRPADTSALVARKRDIVRALRRNLQALTPEHVDRAHIRFYPDLPPWVVQAYDSDDSGAISELEVSVHLSGKHSKYSPRFLVGKDSTLFDGFHREFERRWLSGIPMRGMEIPALDGPISILAVVVDLDGTLILSNEAKRETTWELFQRFSSAGRDVFDDRYSSLEGSPREAILANLWDQFATGAGARSSVAELLNEYAIRYSMRRPSIPEAAGATTFLKEASKRYSLHVVSSAPVAEVTAVLNERNWNGVVTSAHGFPTSKREAISAIAESCRISTREMIFIGDSPQDEMAALASGATSISVSAPSQSKSIALDGLAASLEWLSAQRGQHP